MAALFGVVEKPGRAVPDADRLLRRMQARLAHRAPDGFAHWRGDGVLLGHGALHVGANPSVAVQPLRLQDGRICMVDGFVANHDELRKELGIGPAVILDDAQLFALALQRWGVRFHERVQGEFAVAVWDPAARALDLYRDHLGARPLCYVQTPALFAFASEALPLLELPGVSAQLDPVGIVSIWYDDVSYQDQSHTAFKGMYRLPAGHCLRWQGSGPASLRRYWRMQPLEPLRLADEREYVEAFREAFGGAVARSMRGSSATALMLSGGIDSGAILAARRGFRIDGDAQDLLCISAVSAPESGDPASQAETRNIRALTANDPRALRFEVPVPARGGLVTAADLAQVAWEWIHPMDISLLVSSLACRLARDRGCRLILNGIDGDNMTSAGLYYMAGLIREGSWRRAWSESRQAMRHNTYLQGMAPTRTFTHAMLSALQPSVVRRLRGGWQTQRTIRRIDQHPVMAPVLAQQAELGKRLQAAERRKHGPAGQHRCDHLAHWLTFSLEGSNQIVARHGLEVRHPWCDPEVLAFFLRLPLEFQVRNGWTKYIVRRACEPALGPSVVWHSGKHHLGAILNRQVLEDAAPYLEVLLHEQRPRLREFVRDQAISDAVSALDKHLLADPENCDRVLTIVSLAGWLRHAYAHYQQGVDQ